MKIIFSLGDRLGAAIQFSRLYPKLKNKHKIKVAAFPSAAVFNFPVNWNLASLYYPLSTRPQTKTAKFWVPAISCPLIDLLNAENLLQEVVNFKPDLIISDGERVLPSIAAKLKYPLWYASSLHCLTHINRKYIPMSHYGYFFRTYAETFLKYWPKAERTFIVSPWGALNKLTLKEKGEWIFPEFELLDKSKTSIPAMFCHNKTRLNNWETLKLNLDFPLDSLAHADYSKLGQAAWAWVSGETSLITDGLLSGVPLNIAPDLNDLEQLINAYFAELHQIGTDLRQIELMDRYGINFMTEVEKVMPNIKYKAISQNYPTLSEML